MTRIEQTIMFARNFKRFCEENDMDEMDAARFVRLRDSIGSLTLRGTGALTPRSQKKLDNSSDYLEKLAADYEMKVDFGNPYPALMRGNKYVEIPILP